MEKRFDGTPENYSNSELIAFIVREELTRNKNFSFSKTDRGVTVFKKARVLKALSQEIEKGAAVKDARKDGETTVLVVENGALNYKRTVFLDDDSINALHELDIPIKLNC